MSNGIQTVDRVLRMLSAFGPERLETGLSAGQPLRLGHLPALPLVRQREG
jgi:hypothetical protein